MSSKADRKKISDEMTKFYKKANCSYVKDINTEARDIAVNMGISGKI